MEDKNFKLLTYNIFTGKFRADKKRIDKQLQEIDKLDCDVLCLQEVYHFYY